MPTYNGGRLIEKSIEAINKQAELKSRKIVIDSGSTDSTVSILRKEAEFEVYEIEKKDFEHGKTRNLGVKLLNTDFVIFVTQDAILADENSLKELITFFEQDNSLAVVYGRQLPHSNASPIAQFARTFNYASESHIRGKEDIANYGIKTCYNSNSFAAYRVDIFNELGGFPESIIFGEDMYFAAKAILSGYKVGYCANAMAYHSHNYSLWEDFKRYFDIGVFHKKEDWIREKFNSLGGEGVKYFKAEIVYMFEKHGFMEVIKSFIRNGVKYLAFQLGIHYTKLPFFIVRNFALNKNYWKI